MPHGPFLLNKSFLEQAQAAVQQQNWSAVGHLVEQWLNRGQDEAVVERQTAALTPNPPADPQNFILHLALQVLTFGDFQARWDIAKLLSKFGDTAIAPLIDLLHDDTVELQARWYATRILGSFLHPQSIQALIAAVQSDDDDLSRMAATALANLGAGAITALTPLLASPTTRALAVSALSQIRRSETIVPLLSVVQDPDPNIRTTALEALSSFHDVRVLPALVQALTDPTATMRSTAVLGLGFRTDLAQTLDLVTLVGDRLWDVDLTVCQQAAIALGRIGTPAAVERLFQALRSTAPPQALQLDIVRALAWTGQASALQACQALLCLQDDTAAAPAALTAPLHPDLRLELIRALGQWSTPALKPRVAEILIQALDQPCPLTVDQQSAIALALGELGQPAAIEPLIQQLATPDFRLCLHIIAALKRLDAPVAYARLLDLAASATETPEFRAGIAIALQEW
jgi:HEAT repeat protein